MQPPPPDGRPMRVLSVLSSSNQMYSGIGRNVFELECHDIYIGGEAANGDQVVVLRLDLDVGHLPRGRVGLGREGVDAVAHPARGDGESRARSWRDLRRPDRGAAHRGALPGTARAAAGGVSARLTA